MEEFNKEEFLAELQKTVKKFRKDLVNSEYSLVLMQDYRWWKNC